MNLKCFSALALLAACVVDSSAMGQATGGDQAPPSSLPQPANDAPPMPPQVVAAQAPAPCCRIAALTRVDLEFVDPASSRTSKPGDLVRLRLAAPLIVDGRTVAPAGARVFAEIVQASSAGLMGKAGELTFAARYLEVGDQRVPLKRFGFGRAQGKDPTGTLMTLNLVAAAAMPIASVALIFVSGGNVDIKTGAPAHAVVASETFVPAQQ